MGRPSIYSEFLADAICQRLAGGESLRSICTQEDMPAKTTVFVWLRRDEGFRDQYARAREAQAECFAEEIIDIADDATNDYMLRKNEDASESWRLDSENIQRSRLRVEARKWVVSRILPKKYGERVALEHSGSSNGPKMVIIDI